MKLGLLAAAWLAGTFIGLRIDTAALPLALLILAALSAGVLFRLLNQTLWRFIWPIALTVTFLLAFLRVDTSHGPATIMQVGDGQNLSLVGRVIGDPEATNERIKLLLAVDNLDYGQGLEPFQGDILVYADPPEQLVSNRTAPYFRFGDNLSIEGQFLIPRDFAEFDYPAYLSNQGISGVVVAQNVTVGDPLESKRNVWRGRIFDARRKLSESLEAALPDPQSALAQALILGQRGRLPDDLKEDFRSTGASHLLAISGLHIGSVMVVGLFAAAGVLGRRQSFYLLIPLILIWSYALISGMPPSVVRAAIMGTVYLAALGLGRPRSILPVLALSVAAMVAWSPQALQQVSFQLSFAAMAGIALAIPFHQSLVAAVSSRLSGSATLANPVLGPPLGSLVNWTVGALVVSIGAMLATWPLVAFNFDRIPVLGILVTLLALPALPWILVGSMATAIAGVFIPFLGQIFGWVAWAPLSYLIELVSWIPGFTISGSWISNGFVWAWYLVLGALLLMYRGTIHLWPRGSLPARMYRGASEPGGTLSRPAGPLLGVVSACIILLAANVFIWMQVFGGNDGKLHVYFFDVGQGDSALIVTPSGNQVLIDGGPSTESAITALAKTIPESDHSLDMVVLTHLDADHSRGLLKILHRYEVGLVLASEESPESGMYAQWRAGVERTEVVELMAQSGQQVSLDSDITLEVLNPPSQSFSGAGSDPNNNGVVLRLVYGRVSFLLAADIEMETERRLARNPVVLESTVLKVAHHGSRTSTTPAFLSRANPLVAVISAGQDNRFGHPHGDVLDRLGEALGLDSVYRTDLRGTIEFISDGEKLWVETEK